MTYRYLCSVYLTAALILCPFRSATAADEEMLILPPHPGWGQWKAITEQRSPDRTFIERIPEAQSPNEVKDIVIEQFYRGIQEKISPVELLQKLPMFAQNTNCEKVKASSPVAGVEGGFKVAYAQMYCQKQKGQSYGYIDLQKAIQGSNGIYVVQREWRVNSFEFASSSTNNTSLVPQEAFGSAEKATAWFESVKVSDQYLVKSVFLCSNGDGKRPCK
jgi:hypothetical protein